MYSVKGLKVCWRFSGIPGLTPFFILSLRKKLKTNNKQTNQNILRNTVFIWGVFRKNWNFSLQWTENHQYQRIFCSHLKEVPTSFLSFRFKMDAWILGVVIVYLSLYEVEAEIKSCELHPFLYCKWKKLWLLHNHHRRNPRLITLRSSLKKYSCSPMSYQSNRPK